MKRAIWALIALIIILTLARTGEKVMAQVQGNGMLPVPQLVKDIHLSGSALLNQPWVRLLDMGGSVYFNADDGSHGIELWKSDGSAVGTLLLKDIRPGINASTPTSFTPVNAKFLFSANDGTNGIELWVSNGSKTGTQLLKNINPGGADSMPTSLTSVGNQAFFVANDGSNAFQLWKSDGSAAGTTLVKVISATGMPVPPYIYQTKLTAVNNRLFFSNDEGVNQHELWVSDGSNADTRELKEFTSLVWLTDVNGTLFFSAFDETGGKELWKSDGTTDGTVLVKEINTGYQASSDPQRLVNVNGTLFFSADDGFNGRQLWKSGGSSGNTVMVKQINPTDSSMNYGCNQEPCTDPFEVNQVNLNGTLYFVANDGTHGFELWRSDGSESGTRMVKDIANGSNVGSNPSYLTPVCGRLYFTSGSDLWISDGTDAGTRKLITYASSPRVLTRSGNWLFFAADDSTHGSELWRVYGCDPKVNFLPFVGR